MYNIWAKLGGAMPSLPFLLRYYFLPHGRINQVEGGTADAAAP